MHHRRAAGRDARDLRGERGDREALVLARADVVERARDDHVDAERARVRRARALRRRPCSPRTGSPGAARSSRAAAYARRGCAPYTSRAADDEHARRAPLASRERARSSSTCSVPRALTSNVATRIGDRRRDERLRGEMHDRVGPRELERAAHGQRDRSRRADSASSSRAARRSATTTSWPRARSAATRWRPTKPRAPVTRTRTVRRRERAQPRRGRRAPSARRAASNDIFGSQPQHRAAPSPRRRRADRPRPAGRSADRRRRSAPSRDRPTANASRTNSRTRASVRSR